IDRCTFCHASAHPIARIDFGMLSNPAEERSCDARVARLTQAILDVPLHALILLEVSGDEVRSFLRTDAELLSQPKRRLAIHDAEVHGFRPPALCRCDGVNR